MINEIKILKKLCAYRDETVKIINKNYEENTSGSNIILNDLLGIKNGVEICIFIFIKNMDNHED